MRPIKFRAWDVLENKMLPYCHIREDGLLIHDFLPWGGRKWQLEIMQSTGLHDKNGKEIFEADILKIIYIPGQPAKFYEVIWEKQDASFRIREINPPKGSYDAAHRMYSSFIDDRWKSSYEKVGNIYENLEFFNG